MRKLPFLFVMLCLLSACGIKSYSADPIYTAEDGFSQVPEAVHEGEEDAALVLKEQAFDDESYLDLEPGQYLPEEPICVGVWCGCEAK